MCSIVRVPGQEHVRRDYRVALTHDRGVRRVLEGASSVCRIDLASMLKFGQVKSLGFVGENLGAGTNFAKIWVSHVSFSLVPMNGLRGT